MTEIPIRKPKNYSEPGFFLYQLTLLNQSPIILTKIKLLRANLHGVMDKKFFLFRITKIYAYPHYISTATFYRLKKTWYFED